MIIQSAPPGEPHFVIEQVEHARMAGQMARAFGNRQFDAPQPLELMLHVVAHHDEGWQPVDARCAQSPETGLPHHLAQTPLPFLLETSRGSPDFNSQRHPWCELLSSMHSYGLFSGRYGLSDFVFIDRIAPEHRAAADEMLDFERRRQDALKERLSTCHDTATWVEKGALFNNYKLLQLFDTLSLYFHMTHATDRRAATFPNVPDGTGQDHTLTVIPIESDVCTVSPFPFTGASLQVTCAGRYLDPQPQGCDMRSVLDSTPLSLQTYTLLPET